MSRADRQKARDDQPVSVDIGDSVEHSEIKDEEVERPPQPTEPTPKPAMDYEVEEIDKLIDEEEDKEEQSSSISDGFGSYAGV